MKPSAPDDYDAHAEILNPVHEPSLCATVLKHMFHSPMWPTRYDTLENNGECKKGFPKYFMEFTREMSDSYPLYRRRIKDAYPSKPSVSKGG